MAWIELHQTLPRNRKTLRLKRLLGIKTPQAIGLLCLLWLWALDSAPDGSLAEFTAADIAEVCEWTREPEELTAALTESGFLTAELCLHNWSDYTGRLLAQREVKKEQARDRQRRYRERLRAGREAEVTRENSVSHAPIPYPTKPNPILPMAKENSVLAYYLSKINPTASPLCLQELSVFAGELGDEVCRHAVDIAIDEKKTGWSYIRAILQRYHGAQVRSVEDVRRLEEQRTRARGQTAAAARSNADFQRHGEPPGPFARKRLAELLAQEDE